jgi:hypothetical protein
MSSVEPTLLDGIQGPQGLIEPERLSRLVEVSPGELATTLGLTLADVSAPAEWASSAVQDRLREFTRIIQCVLPYCGSPRRAFEWFRWQVIPGFGEQTPEDLVRTGRAEHVLSYLEGIAEGGYA